MWVEVANRRELQRARKTVVEADGREIVLVWHDGAAYALDNVCIHQQRSLVKGVILNGRLVCPGHQWAYELTTGYCREKDRCQPTYPVRLDGDVVLVDVSAAPAEEPSETTVDLA